MGYGAIFWISPWDSADVSIFQVRILEMVPDALKYVLEIDAGFSGWDFRNGGRWGKIHFGNCCWF